MKNNTMSATEMSHRGSFMVVSFFDFQIGDRVIWNAPVTRSMYAIFNGYEVKADGNEYAKITTLPGMSGEPVMRMEVLADQLVPAWD
jgi:hypothetical protein